MQYDDMLLRHHVCYMDIPAKAVSSTYQFIEDTEADNALSKQRIFAWHLNTTHLCVRQSQPIYGKAAVKPCSFRDTGTIQSTHSPTLPPITLVDKHQFRAHTSYEWDCILCLRGMIDL